MTVPRIRQPSPDPAVFAGSPLLAAISQEDLRDLVGGARTRTFGAGELLFQRGDAGDGIYAIVSGSVRIVLEGRGGTEVLVRALTTGDVFGELSALDGAPRSATAIAETPVRALHIDVERFRGWVENHPAVALPMLAQLAHRLRTTSDQVAEIGLLGVEARIARRLWQRFEEAGGRAGTRLRINQGDLASELSVTRESVNKHLARLKLRRVLSVERGYVILLDAAALAAAAREP